MQFCKKTLITYLSYLQKEKIAFSLKMNIDAHASFTKLMTTASCDQFLVNVFKQGITKGQYWQNSKWEFFIAVAGHGLIQKRKIGTDAVLNLEVTGDKIEVIYMLPGYTQLLSIAAKRKISSRPYG